jgi:hypothetical protein
VKEVLDYLSEPIIRTDQTVQKMYKNLEGCTASSPCHIIGIGLAETFSGQRRREILNWISTIAYEDNHETAALGLLEGTGAWLRNKGEFREWQASSASEILWLRGKRKPV